MPASELPSESGRSSRKPKAEDVPLILPTIQKLKAGTLSPKLLSASARQSCIEELVQEGMTVAEIAMIFKTSERTIYRDLVRIRKRNAIDPRSLKAGELLGNFLKNIRVSMSRARRATRDKAARPEDKIDAERVISQVEMKVFDQMVRLGLVPRHEVVARTHVQLSFDDGVVPDEDASIDFDSLDEDDLGNASD